MTAVASLSTLGASSRVSASLAAVHQSVAVSPWKVMFAEVPNECTEHALAPTAIRDHDANAASLLVDVVDVRPAAVGCPLLVLLLSVVPQLLAPIRMIASTAAGKLRRGRVEWRIRVTRKGTNAALGSPWADHTWQRDQMQGRSMMGSDPVNGFGPTV